MNRGTLATLFFTLAASACGGGKGPPARVAEVPIDDGTPRVPTAAAATPGLTGGTSSTGAAAAIPGVAFDPSAAFGGGGAGGGGAGAAASAGGGGGGGGGGGAVEGLPMQLPAMLPTMTDVPTPGAGARTPSAATASNKPLPPKAERLTAADCNKVMDKYIELVGISQGISPDAIAGVMGMLRNSVANDANYANALGTCQKENTKTQYRCAMKAKDVDGWKKCLE